MLISNFIFSIFSANVSANLFFLQTDTKLCVCYLVSAPFCRISAVFKKYWISWKKDFLIEFYYK